MVVSPRSSAQPVNDRSECFAFTTHHWSFVADIERRWWRLMTFLTAQNNTNTSGLGQMLNKVPEITIYFWIIKVLCTTVGETFADYLNVDLGFGSYTLYFVGALLVVALAVQFATRRYVATIYWVAVVVSVSSGR